LANRGDTNFPEKASRIFPAVRRLRHSPLAGRWRYLFYLEEYSRHFGTTAEPFLGL
jgi:hypothetical protein